MIKEINTTKFETIDGKRFDDKASALKHQQYLEDKKNGKFSYVITLQYCGSGYDELIAVFDDEEEAKKQLGIIEKKDNDDYMGNSINQYNIVETLRNPISIIK